MSGIQSQHTNYSLFGRYLEKQPSEDVVPTPTTRISEEALQRRKRTLKAAICYLHLNAQRERLDPYRRLTLLNRKKGELKEVEKGLRKIGQQKRALKRYCMPALETQTRPVLQSAPTPSSLERQPGEVLSVIGSFRSESTLNQ